MGKQKKLKTKGKKENDKPMWTLHMGFFFHISGNICSTFFFSSFLSGLERKHFSGGPKREHSNSINFPSSLYSNQTSTKTIFFSTFLSPFSISLKSL